MELVTLVAKRAATLTAAVMFGVTPGGAAAQRRTSPSRVMPPAPVVIEVSRDRFDWQDAGVGATGMLALVAIGFGVALVVGRTGPPPRKGKQ